MKYHLSTAAFHTLLVSIAITMCSSQALCGPRDVHIDSFFARDNKVFIVNFNTAPVALDGWRFMTSNTSETEITSDPDGLDGIVIPPLSHIVIQLDNDADLEGGINAQDIGAFAEYQPEAYMITLFFPDANGDVSFDDVTQIADHIQWSVNASHHPIAEDHAQRAVDAGLWTAQDAWIDGREHMYFIEIINNPSGQLHSPEDYEVLLLTCRADINHDGNSNFFDVSAFLTSFSQSAPIADMNNDGEFNFFDVSLFLTYFANNEGCF